MPYGLRGRILRVDLTDRRCEIEEPGEAFYRTYLGGACLGGVYLLKEVKANVDPYHPNSMLVLATGVTTGIRAPGFVRYAAVGKSPLTGGIVSSEAGGFWGPELKAAGYDAVVIRGKADGPVYLWITSDGIEFKPAGHLWGLEPKEAQKAIREEVGEQRARVALIGPAGEKLVRFACITNGLKNYNGRGGLGAVMGAKNLKAIAVKGRGELPVYDPGAIRELARDFRSNFASNPDNHGLHHLGTAYYLSLQNADGQLPTRNFKSGFFNLAEQIGAAAIQQKYEVVKDGCWACPVRCKKSIRTTGQRDAAYGLPEYESLAALGSYCCLGEVAAVVEANELCNRYGLDTISTGAAVAFAMECYEAGLLGTRETGGLELRFGNAEAALELIKMIGERRGLGELLGEGVARAAASLGWRAGEFAMVCGKGRELPAHDPRAKAGLALAYALSPNGADHVVAEHDSCFTEASPPLFLERLRPLGLEPMPAEELSARKVRMFFYLQSLYSAFDSLGLCVFTAPPVRYWSYDQVLAVVRAATGWDMSFWELMKVGERKTTLFRCFNVREGFSARHDRLPRRMFEGSVSGPRQGQRRDPAELEEAKALYYAMAGWDADGRPTRARLVELGLDWVDLG